MFFKKFSFFNTIIISKFSVLSIPICTPFLFNWIWIKFNWIWIQYKIRKFPLIEPEFNKIELKLHAMSFNISIWMELKFQTINSLFWNYWLSLVVFCNIRPKLSIWFSLIHVVGGSTMRNQELKLLSEVIIYINSNMVYA